jgi:hypothetical protein
MKKKSRLEEISKQMRDTCIEVTTYKKDSDKYKQAVSRWYEYKKMYDELTTPDLLSFRESNYKVKPIFRRRDEY